MTDNLITIDNAAEALVYDDTKFSSLVKWLTEKNRILEPTPVKTALFFYFLCFLVGLCFYSNGIFLPQLRENQEFYHYIVYIRGDGLYFLTDWYRLFILLYISILTAILPLSLRVNVVIGKLGP